MQTAIRRTARPTEAETPLITHRPVLLQETLAGLAPRTGGIYMDATFGRGGHSAAILDALAGSGRLLALDQDPQACAVARERFGDRDNFSIFHANFEQIGTVADQAGVSGRVDGVLFDLGVSSPQLDEAERGFSFSHDGPLDMRMNPLAGESAAAWLMRTKEPEIADVLWKYGEERNSRRIARRIVEARLETPLTRTAQLAALIASVPGPRTPGIHPATRSFQAIRIHINRELDVLPQALAEATRVLAPGGRLAVISFHSLEDRLVKRYLRGDDERQMTPDDPFSARRQSTRLRAIGREFPSDAEISANPRSRSAVLRVAEKAPAGEVRA